MKETIRKRISKICVISLIASMFINTNIYVSKADATDYGISNPRISEDGTVTWDKIQFGSYIQNAEPIKWRILSVSADGTDAFVMADKALDCKPYNDKGVEKTSERGIKYMDYECTWETCTLRKWLNEDFLNAAFNKEERQVIKDTKVINGKNTINDTSGGIDTFDKIYLLSQPEVCNKSYGFAADNSDLNKARRIQSTGYAKNNGLYVGETSQNYGYCYWWLRSPGSDRHYSMLVSFNGKCETNGSGVFQNNGVCPVLHINLNSPCVTDAGEVDSEGNIKNSNDGYRNPRVSDSMTTWDCVYFGKYEQNCKKEPIEWRVLSVVGDDALLLADNGLDCKPYNNSDESVTWEDCSLRSWLNNDFLATAFNANEQLSIKETQVGPPDDSYDIIFILSDAEAINEKYGFDSKQGFSATREIAPTEYALVSGAYIDESDDNSGKGNWWLRTPGSKDNYAMYTYYNGAYGNIGSEVNRKDYMVCPAMHISLSAYSWKKAGTVSAKLSNYSGFATTSSPTGSSTSKADESIQNTNMPALVTTEPNNNAGSVGASDNVEHKDGNNTSDGASTEDSAKKTQQIFYSGNLKFKVEKTTNGKYEVTVIGVKNKKCKSISIESYVIHKKEKYKVTKIGSKFVKGCKKLKKIYIKSKYIKKMDKKAFKGMNKKCEIRVPKALVKKYSKMIKIS